MKKTIGLWLSGILMLSVTGSYAQSYAEEALMFSRINPGGSARIQAMGGAQVALGGDYSSSFSNPAGLGFFNKSEATLSLGTNFYNSKSNYFGTDTKDSKSNFNIPGFSLVFHSDKNNGKFVSGNFAISFTRTNNFNQTFSYKGVNPDNSLIDYFMEQSSGYYPNQFSENGGSYYYLTRLGFNNYLFGPMSEIVQGGDSSTYHSYADKTNVEQHEQVQITGAQNQFNVSYGANFGDAFYLGATVGFPSFNYRSKKAYSEFFPYGPLIGFNLNEDYSIKGSGINATFGAIVKPKDFIQLGLSVATPTYFYSIADNYSATLNAGWDNYNYVDVTYPSHNKTLSSTSDGIDQLISNYTLTTPWRLKAGATVFIQKKALITAEIEKVNYGKSSLTSQTDGLDFTYDNQDIKKFASVVNIRGGGEYRFGGFRVRAGYSYMPDPYIAIQNGTDNSITSISGGLGYRTNKYTIDLGYINTNWNSSYRPYTISSVYSPVVITKNSNSSIMVTFGFTL
ncbi:MAG: hypothetical protein JSS79_00565 [Bacteroidetes bacterium]|nr:hypothetical protein [Bacteroidota bacterium]